MPTDKNRFLPDLEVQIEAELATTEPGTASAEAFDVPPTEWLFDPTDVERENVGLRSLLGAVEALESETERNTPMDTTEPLGSSMPTVEEDAHLAAAAYLMQHSDAPALVVRDDEEEGARPVGMVTKAELAEALAEGMDVEDARVRDVMTAE